MEEEIKKLPWYKRIHILRTMKEWSQREAAEQCGTNQQTFQLWETGKSYPRFNSRKAIASAFGVSVEEIFTSQSN